VFRFREKKVVIEGIEFRLREPCFGDVLKVNEIQDDTEKIIYMLSITIVEPKLTIEQLKDLPARIITILLNEANELFTEVIPKKS